MNTEENNIKTLKNKSKPKRKTKELKELKNKINGGEYEPTKTTTSPYISTQPNFDPSYTEIGILHTSKSIGVNVIRDTIAGIANMFGYQGGMDKLYNKTRTEAITEIISAIKQNQKVCNLKIDIGSLESSIITFNLYGTLFQKVSIPPPQQVQQQVQQQVPPQQVQQQVPLNQHYIKPPK